MALTAILILIHHLTLHLPNLRDIITTAALRGDGPLVVAGAPGQTLRGRRFLDPLQRTSFAYVSPTPFSKYLAPCGRSLVQLGFGKQQMRRLSTMC